MDDAYPPPESGVLGPSIGPSSLTLTLGVGASLFDDRFALADRRPRQLAQMPRFPGDVIDPSRVHGDLVLQICAVDEMACMHALRYLMAGTRADMSLRWTQDGFHRPDAIAAEGKTTTRNLLGFKDGMANPSLDSDLFRDLVWVAPDAPEPSWTTGGSYMVVRLIRMFVERWDRAPLAEQEAIIGRGYSFSRGFDDAGSLDQGLAFHCFQRDLHDGFATVQAGLANEPLAEYIQAQGGGYFFALPGVAGPGENLGDGLLG